MMRQNTKEKIESIEEQIKKLKEKQKRIMNNSQKEIGKYLMKKWGIDDVNEAKLLIDAFKDQIQSYIEASSSKEEENTRSLNNLKR